MAKRNAAVVRRAVEDIWNRGDLTMADRLFDSTYINHGGLIPDLVHGPEAVKISVALFRTAFPTLHIRIDRLTVDGDTVELRWVAGSTSDHARAAGRRGNQPGRLTGTTLSTLADGKIVESWTDWDHVTALQRLETIPLETQA
jgi:predicted SnoaL-like aldol condensation-catalyzing enzyme